MNTPPAITETLERVIAAHMPADAGSTNIQGFTYTLADGMQASVFIAAGGAAAQVGTLLGTYVDNLVAQVRAAAKVAAQEATQ